MLEHALVDFRQQRDEDRTTTRRDMVERELVRQDGLPESWSAADEDRLPRKELSAEDDVEARDAEGRRRHLEAFSRHDEVRRQAACRAIRRQRCNSCDAWRGLEVGDRTSTEREPKTHASRRVFARNTARSRLHHSRCVALVPVRAPSVLWVAAPALPERRRGAECEHPTVRRPITRLVRSGTSTCKGIAVARRRRAAARRRRAG